MASTPPGAGERVSAWTSSAGSRYRLALRQARTRWWRASTISRPDTHWRWRARPMAWPNSARLWLNDTSYVEWVWVGLPPEDLLFRHYRAAKPPGSGEKRF